MSEVKYKICPVCGGRMYKGNGMWLCGNCDAILFEDRNVIPIINDAARPTEATEATFWCKFRAEAAKDILCAFASNEHIELSKDNIEKSVESSIALADILIIKLKGDGKE